MESALNFLRCLLVHCPDQNTTAVSFQYCNSVSLDITNAEDSYSTIVTRATTQGLMNKNSVLITVCVNEDACHHIIWIRVRKIFTAVGGVRPLQEKSLHFLSFILCRSKSGMIFYKLLKVCFNVSQNLLQWNDVCLGV
jgi:hypothetical protein